MNENNGIYISGIDTKIILNNKGITVEKSKSLSETKEEMLKKLQEHNVDIERKVTRLYFNFHGQKEYVEDYSSYLGCMSDELKQTLASGKTVTGELKNELESYVIESVYNAEGKVVDLIEHFINQHNDLMDTVEQLVTDVSELKKEVLTKEKFAKQLQNELDKRNIRRASGLI